MNWMPDASVKSSSQSSEEADRVLSVVAKTSAGMRSTDGGALWSLSELAWGSPVCESEVCFPHPESISTVTSKHRSILFRTGMTGRLELMRHGNIATRLWVLDSTSGEYTLPKPLAYF